MENPSTDGVAKGDFMGLSKLWIDITLDMLSEVINSF